MCNAFSCVATRNKVNWKAGMDSHEKFKRKFNLDDSKLGNLVPIEILPNQSYKYPYLHPEKKWTLKFDSNSGVAPDWWKSSNERMCWDAFESWKKKVYSGIDLKGILNPINPFQLPAVKKVTKVQVKLLMEWAFVWDSVGTSIWNFMKDSTGTSVWDSIWDSVWNPMKRSVMVSAWGSGISMENFGNSVWAYISSFFPKNKFKTDFSSCIKLWKMGLVPSFDGKTCRLHTGKDAHVIYSCARMVGR